jgi:hypothetical protein
VFIEPEKQQGRLDAAALVAHDTVHDIAAPPSEKRPPTEHVFRNRVHGACLAIIF